MPFFVVRQQRLGNAQIFGGLLLRHALFLCASVMILLKSDTITAYPLHNYVL